MLPPFIVLWFRLFFSLVEGGSERNGREAEGRLSRVPCNAMLAVHTHTYIHTAINMTLAYACRTCDRYDVVYGLRMNAGGRKVVDGVCGSSMCAITTRVMAASSRFSERSDDGGETISRIFLIEKFRNSLLLASTLYRLCHVSDVSRMVLS